MSPSSAAKAELCRCFRRLAASGAIALAAMLPGGSEWRADELDERRARLERMSPADKRALLRKQQRFERLSADQQQRLRRLHSAIAEHDDRARLRQVLSQYNEWLKTLSAGERANLLGLPPDRRIQQIKKLKQQQENRTFGLPGDGTGPPGDAEKLVQWANSFVRRHNRELLAELPPAFQEQVLNADPRRRHRMLLLALVGAIGRRRITRLPSIDRAELESLSEALSPRARQLLESESDWGQKQLLVHRWIQAAVLATLLPPVEDSELRRFFDEELTDDERARFDELAPDARQRQLRRLYFLRRYNRAPPRLRGPLMRQRPPPRD